MLTRVTKYLEEHPIKGLLIIAAIPRLVSVIFSKGYGMHDDHFLIIEAAQSWVDGVDYNLWLPEDPETSTPTGHSWFYAGLHYFLFSFLELLGMNDPHAKMYIVRFLHASYSLLVIPPIFHIVRKAADQKLALQAGLLVSLLWFMPILSVRNLVEMVCVPPLVWAAWLLFKNEEHQWKNVALAGLLCGLAMAFRFHSILFLGGFGLVLLMERKLVPAILLGVACFAALFITQIGDLFIWERPFAEFSEYIRYNFANKTTYFNRPWYQYFGTVLGLLIPPVSLMLMLGFTKTWKKHLILFLPILVFFGFHSYFPNKQERFILPMIPLFIALGMMGWHEFKSNMARKWIKGFDRWSWRFFWMINTLVLLLVTPAYTKKSRVEAMYLLGQHETYIGSIEEYSTEYESVLLPEFYADKWVPNWYFYKGEEEKRAKGVKRILQDPPVARIQHVIFFEEEELSERKERLKTELNADLTELAVIEPSYLDKLLHWLNPNNSNETAFVYHIEYKE